MNTISIIMPVFNAERSIDRCLSVLQKLDYPKENLEIILMDNGSTDQTLTIAQKYPVRIFKLPGATVSRLRNGGAEKAKGEILAFIDADCVAPVSWLKRAANSLKDPAYGAVGCWYKLPKKNAFWERVWNSHMSARRLKTGSTSWVPSGNFIVRKDIYQNIGGFDETLTTSEDVDICRRIREAGYQVFSHPDLAVVHLGESKDLKHFLLKEKWRGEGVLQNLVHEFPNVRYNKSLIFSLVTLLSVIGIFLSILARSGTGLEISLFFLLSIPFYLAVKACVVSKEWRYCAPLAFLFLVYAFARLLSAFNPKIWRT